MKLLALDTASAQCSAALLLGDELIAKEVNTARDHAQLILPMIDSLLAQAQVTLRQLDGIAFGRGPGSFTGVRVAVGVTQGLALGADLPVLPVSDLRALARQAMRLAGESGHGAGFALACMDARMGEVYWACHDIARAEVGALVGCEGVCNPQALPDTLVGKILCAAGMGLGAHPQIVTTLRIPPKACLIDAEPHAQDIARLAAIDLCSGAGWLDAAAAQPVYLRDQVVQTAPQPHRQWT
jgi:tRNA threonylcarbamoyladenosine biosynthesis protein TsaB